MVQPQQYNFNDGAAYERFMAPWSRSAGALFMDWLGQNPGLTWADIGCGNGAFSRLILDKAAPSSVSAIDPSDGQVAFAKKSVTDRRVSFSVGDAMALPFADGQFDVGVMALVLFFVPDAPKGAAEMARVTKRGGTVASYTWDITRGGSPTRHVGEECEALGKPAMLPPSASVSRFETLTALWTEIGVGAVETRELVVERTFANFDDYWTCMVASSPTSGSRNLSEAETVELRRRLQAKLPTSASGAITVHAWATAIKGTKLG